MLKFVADAPGRGKPGTFTLKVNEKRSVLPRLRALHRPDGR